MRLSFLFAFVGGLLVVGSLATASHCFRDKVGSACVDWNCECRAEPSEGQCVARPPVTQLRGTSGPGRCTLYIPQSSGWRQGRVTSGGCGDGFARSAKCKWLDGICQCTSFGPEVALGYDVDSWPCFNDCTH